LRRETINRIGGLDEELFLGNDDLELSWRLRLFGYKLLIAVDTFVAHVGQESFKSLEEEKQDELARQSSNSLFAKLQKYYGKNDVPEPIRLWGIDWFKPDNAKYNPKTRLMDIKEKYKKVFNIKDTEIIVSIIAPVFNQTSYTQEFLTSLGEFIPYSTEIIIIDNNSEQETKEFLAVYKNTCERVEVIENKENYGFPKAINQGLKIAKGEYVVIANNERYRSYGELASKNDSPRRIR
ncbi:MAG: glycosyltransferase, partial [Chlorobi bacterium]|nr:glycosyltransferase [Chlorobiota bacterium]